MRARDENRASHVVGDLLQRIIMGLGFWGFRVWGLGLKVLGLGFRAEEYGCLPAQRVLMTYMGGCLPKP